MLLRLPSSSNVQFMSVEDFDLLCHAVAASRIGFAEALDQAKATDIDPSSRKFEFRQHMRGWPFYDELRKELEASFMRLLNEYAAKYNARISNTSSGSGLSL